MSELYTDVNGIKISFNLFGRGPPIILLHGFGMYKDFWIGQKPLSDKFQLISLDNRGCGGSSHPIESYEIEDMADDVKKLMDYLNIEKAHVIGHSLGGMIAQRFAIKYPERLMKLILIATFPKLPLDKSGIEMYRNSQLSMYEAKLKDPKKAFYDKMKQRFTRNFFKLMVEEPTKMFHNLFTTEDLMELEKNGTSKPPDILNLIHAIVNHNTLDSLQKVKNETLILVGEKDRITSKLSSIQMHEKFPNSTLKVFKGGHFFPLEEAPEVNKCILDFLAK